MKIDTTTSAERSYALTEANSDAPRIVLMLGSNVMAEAQLQAAWRLLTEQFAVLGASAQYWSAADGTTTAPPYLNQAVVIRTTLARDDLRPALRAIEAQLGRQRPNPNPGLCALDIDAIGRMTDQFQIWDAKSYKADYAALPLADLGIPALQPPL